MRLHSDYDPPRSPGFIVVVTAGYAVVTTTVQKLIVVVSAATAVATTVQKFIVVVCAATAGNYDCTETYREEGREGGILKVALNSLKIKYVIV